MTAKWKQIVLLHGFGVDKVQSLIFIFMFTFMCNNSGHPPCKESEVKVKELIRHIKAATVTTGNRRGIVSLPVQVQVPLMERVPSGIPMPILVPVAIL
jgi:hypothetical protein